MRRIELSDGAYLELHEGWLPQVDADSAFRALSDEVPWQERAIRIFGREVMQPRLVAWIGDADAAYTYSAVLHEPLPWTSTLSVLRERLARELGLSFNAVLCNLYRDGHDSMGMHSDDEPELGRDPEVASISLGAVRTFVLRHKKGPTFGKLDVPLAHGSLLVMRGTTQRFYRHGIGKLRAPTPPRINLTFRAVQKR